MTQPKYPLRVFDGTNTSDVQQLNVPAGAIDPNGIVDLGVGNPVPKVYRALLSQTGTDAPTATVLENSLGGTVVWTRNDAGDYFGTLAGVFLASKTFVLFGYSSASEGKGVQAWRSSDNVVRVQTLDAGTPADDFMGGNPIEILVYP